MEKGLISIITPAYNSEKFIEETYQSIKHQTYKNWEWLVIDDNSSDKTFEILKRLSKEDLRIKIYKNTTNLRAASSRNKGLDNSSGQYITFIDSDDLWSDFFLEEQLKFLKTNKAQVVFSSYDRVSEDLNTSYGAYIVPLRIEVKDLLKTNYMSCLTTLYKVDFLKEMRFRKGLKMHEDYVMWLNFLEKVKIAYGNPKILAKYRIREESVSRKKIENLKYMFFIYREIQKYNFFKTFTCLFNYIYYGIKKNKGIKYSKRK
ncbi:MAG: glycosyltransferase family 2 protein [Fusobacteriaceae bacterium]